MKKAMVLILVAFVLSALTGCIQKSTVSFASKRQIKKVKEDKPLSLKEALRDNENALRLADEERDFLTPDQFIEWIGFAKDRDKEAQTKENLAALTAAVNAAQASLSQGQPVETIANQPISPSPTPASASGTTPAPVDSGTQSTVVTEDNAIATERFTSADGGYSIEFLSDWALAELTIFDINSIVGLSPPERIDDDFLENVSVTVEPLLFNVKLDDHANATIANLEKNLTDYKQLERTETTVGGEKATKIIYTYTTNGLTVKSIMRVAVKDARAYLIIASTTEGLFDAKSELLENSANSFRFE